MSATVKDPSIYGPELVGREVVGRGDVVPPVRRRPGVLRGRLPRQGLASAVARRLSSQLAGGAGDGDCASHSRFFCGLRRHLESTPAGRPITFALANPKLDERDVAIDMFDHDPILLDGRAGQTLIADKGYVSADFERVLSRTRHRTHQTGPQRRTTTARRPPAPLAAPDHRIGQRHLERRAHPGTTRRPQLTRRHCADPPTASRPHCRIWHNHHSGQPVLRSLTAYDTSPMVI